MNPNEAIEKYTEVVLKKSDLEHKKQELVDKVITPEIKAQLADIDAEFAEVEAMLNREAEDLANVVKDAVIATEQTVRGTTHMAVYSKPRVSWDTKMLDGLALVLPQVNEAKTIGQPSVSIRLIK
jgi:hypothetical protein